MITYIVFSKDRPAQLDALLRSMDVLHIKGDRQVIYAGYGYVGDDFTFDDGFEYIVHPTHKDKSRMIQQSDDFKSDVLSHMGTKYTCFLVDDMQFIDNFIPAGREWYEFVTNPKIACLSLRLGLNIDYSYPKRKKIKVPEFPVSGLNIWDWRGYESYWGYPMSLDGHIFKTEDIKPMIEDIEFNNPNELEGQLAVDPIEKPLMICYDKPKVVNYPMNLVQTVCENRHMGLDAELLNETYKMGYRMKLMQPINHNSCHVEQYPEWE